jgi:glycosyltransferase involved in cell wall biosynthesis
MKILVALPLQHPGLNSLPSIDNVLDGTSACSGTDGSIIRLADFLTEAGWDVWLSAAVEIPSTKFPCIKHEAVEATQFDRLVVHQSHWDGASITFGNQFLSKTYLWLHKFTCTAFVYNFFRAGGHRVVCPSRSHANTYRSLPQWHEKVAVIYNSYSPIFTPTPEQAQPRLLFIGAITRYKGFVELMDIWSYLAQKEVNLTLAIAGSISLHKGSQKVGAMGIAEANFETNHIQPWLKTLPKTYQPDFLGALAPLQLRTEIAKSCAIIVNCSWEYNETFCVSAVEAQACDRTVFSVATGGLKETVYQGAFNSLAQNQSIESVCNCIIQGLSAQNTISKNGQLAGEYVRSKFSKKAIIDVWINLLSGNKSEPILLRSWDNSLDLGRDLMRWSGAGMLIHEYRRLKSR